MNLLLNAFVQQWNIRGKREAEKKMDCNTFLDNLSMFENLISLMKTPEIMAGNLKKIQNMAHEVKSNELITNVDMDSCKTFDQSEIEEKLQSTRKYLGISFIYSFIFKLDYY